MYLQYMLGFLRNPYKSRFHPENRGIDGYRSILSHPHVCGARGNPGLLGHTNGSLGYTHKPWDSNHH